MFQSKTTRLLINSIAVSVLIFILLSLSPGNSIPVEREFTKVEVANDAMTVLSGIIRIIVNEGFGKADIDCALVSPLPHISSVMKHQAHILLSWSRNDDRISFGFSRESVFGFGRNSLVSLAADGDLSIDIHKRLIDDSPEIVKFLTKLSEDSKEIQLMSILYSCESSSMTGPESFLRDYSEIWSQWVPDHVYSKTCQALESI